jgi:prephenate dehydratase
MVKIMQKEKLRIVTLGPKGTFSHQASLKIKTLLDDKGIPADILFATTIRSLFGSLDQKGDIIVVPIENSEAGTVGISVDQLAINQDKSLQIILELNLLIEHYLAGYGTLDKIRTVYTHPQSHAQCDIFLEERLPDVEIIHTASNSKSASFIAESKSMKTAAIIPEIASRIYSLPIIQEKIQNTSNNTTRFIALIKNHQLAELFNLTKTKKTTIIVDPQDNYPGLLHDILSFFAEKQINLSRIESRPSKRKLGDYIFHIDIEGDIISPNITSCIKSLESKFSVRKLGSYNCLE